MKALVTGATGFLGSRLVRELVAQGHSVAILARPASSFHELASVRDSLRVYVVDDRPDTLRRAVVAEAPDIVFHLATYYKRDHEAADVAPMLEANVGFPVRLIDAMAREGVSRLVNTGSAWQYFEAESYRPVCLHSASKQAFESLLTYFVDSGAIDCITLVMHDTYGPHDPRRKIFRLLRDNAGKLEPLELSRGEQIVNLIHVRDAVAAYCVAAQRLLANDNSRRHEIFSVSGEQPMTLQALVEAYLEYADIKVAIRWGARPYHAREVMQAWQGGATLPGWRPQIHIEQGLRELAREVRTDTHLLSTRPA